ncbi:MAG TPA: hypothetical protein VIO32_10415 [Candidatus Baltobacteraceae bacterium]
MSARTLKQNAHLTYKANLAAGRHSWLRLTPAYSIHLVRAYARHAAQGTRIVDPFSGSGTTALACAEFGHDGYGLDINPFLVWFGSAKTRRYETGDIQAAARAIPEICAHAQMLREEPGLWEPPLFNIERWWNPGALQALKALLAAIRASGTRGAPLDLLHVAFCRTMIASSNAAFNHQSMSFAPGSSAHSKHEGIIGRYLADAQAIVESAAAPLSGNATLFELDSRRMDENPAGTFDMLLTSPPYVNRMSYIRELRPYMYWLGYLRASAHAGQLDWQAIGGTWGSATSNLNAWEPPAAGTPVDAKIARVCRSIARDGAKNGALLSTYVVKYFHDMWQHFQAAQRAINAGGKLVYIVGNSTFYGHVVPAQDWYAAMLAELGFTNVDVKPIRKRNSKKELVEYAVSALR